MKTDTGYRIPDTAIVAALGILLLITGCGRAEWHEADARLNLASMPARDEGFVPMQGPHNTFGTFTEAGSTTWRVHLEPHQPYVLVAACAMACDSLDFNLTDSNHDESFTDTTAGPTPRLAFTPIEGNLRINFRHGACTSGRCRWVAQVYERRVAPH